MKRQYKVASDGMVYFVEGGLLQVIDTLEEYKEMIARKEKEAEELSAFIKKRSSTYFEITVDGTYYKQLMVDRDGVFRILATIKNFEKRVEETSRYFKEKEVLGYDYTNRNAKDCNKQSKLYNSKKDTE